jgi:GDP-4-dehydro-6-deoxy-D-mannose reductase
VSRAVITGGNGFVGRYLTARLSAQGHTPIPLDATDAEAFDVTDPELVRARFAQARPDVIYHLAARTHVGDSWDAPGATWRVNTEGTLNVLLAAHAVGASRVLVVGSSDQYGAVAAADQPIRESCPLRPNTPYAASKAAAELLALQQARAGHIDVVCVRAFNHTGAGQPPSFLVPALAHRIARAELDGTSELRVGNLDAERDFSDVRDVVRAYTAVMEHGESGAVYNVCSGRAVAVRAIADALVAQAGHALELVVDPALARPVDTPTFVGDPSALIAATGWAPEFSLAETLTAVLDAARVYEKAQPISTSE